MTTKEKVLPWLVAGLGVVYLLWVLAPASTPGPDEFNVLEFAVLPVMESGRIKPIDTVARSSLTVITHKQTFRDEKDVRQPAIIWLLDTLAQTGSRHKIFRIENDELLDFLGLKARPSLRYAPKEFEDRLPSLFQRIAKVDTSKPSLFEAKAMDLLKQWEVFKKLETEQMPLASAPFGRGKDDWYALYDIRKGGFGDRDLSTSAFGLILNAYEAGEPRTFNKYLALYFDRLKELLPDDMDAARFEVLFNRFEPFHQASVLYIFAFLLGCLSWLGWSKSLNHAGFYLCLLGFLVHTWAIFGRMYILGRPPVINLYSSAVFIGWCCTGVTLLVEPFFRNSISLVVGSALAAITAGVIGHYLSLDGDTMVMMQAVLDTNLWLATHVTIVTFGYAATFFAGFIGILFIILGLFTPLLNKNGVSVLGKMIYGVICFATLLSFTGTVLGGIWADQSWGRFWGWDPKENGALLIVIWNAMILHARWAGMIKQRGVAVLAVAGNIVTAWSWFGTNLLGVGLHNYGFMSGAMWGILGFDASQFVIIGLGLIPTRYWISYRSAAPGSGAPKPQLDPVNAAGIELESIA